MARQYNITLREEFDEHDTPDTKYIVILDGEFPVATCRLYELPEDEEPVPAMMFGGSLSFPSTGNRDSDALSLQRLRNGRKNWDAGRLYWTAGMWRSGSMRSWDIRLTTAEKSREGRSTASTWKRCSDGEELI